jgi:hypothetical protein
MRVLQAACLFVLKRPITAKTFFPFSPYPTRKRQEKRENTDADVSLEAEEIIKATIDAKRPNPVLSPLFLT